MKPENAVKLDRTIGRFVYKFHLFIYRLTRGIIGHRTSQGPILLLTTIGRKSGQPRVHPLLYMPQFDKEQPVTKGLKSWFAPKPIPDRFYVVGSNGGRPGAPAWLLNLRESPQASLQVGKMKWKVNAEILEGERKEQVWPTLTAHYKGWAHYETLTDRPIYPVCLVPVPDSNLDYAK